MVEQEFISGFNLADFLKERKEQDRAGLSCPWISWVRMIAKNLFQGVATMHENGCVHRDLRCKNVMITTSYKGYITGLSKAKILDFGFSRKIEEEERALTPINQEEEDAFTSISLPPEAEKDESGVFKGYDKKVDAWGCGCILFELLYGRPIFEEEQTRSDFLNQKTKLEDLFPQLQDDLIPPKYQGIYKKHMNLLTQLLDPNPDSRISVSGALDHPFFLGEEEIFGPYAWDRIETGKTLGREFTSLSPSESID